MSRTPVEQEIHALEARRDQAMLDADADTLARLLGDALVYTYWSGASEGKLRYVESVKTKRFVYRRIERPEERIQLYGDVAVVTGGAHVDVLVAGTPRVAQVRYISVWAKGAQGWQTVAYQTTPILS